MPKTQRVLVTAGAAGIGRAVARVFRDAGARVHICDIDESALQLALAEDIGLSGSLTDVGEEAAVEKLFAEVMDRLGGLDVLVNNAGIGGGNAAIEEIEGETWRRTLDVNLSGMFYCVKAATPGFKEQGGGVILNISTASVRTGLPNRLPYIASKHGVMGLTQNAARELGPHGIRCNAILPGLIAGPRGRAILEKKAADEGITFEEAEAGFLRFVSMRCWIDPAEVGDLAVFLASDKARHITGQFIAVDGHMEWEE